MAFDSSPPILPLRPSDSNSRFLAKDLLLAYPMLESGTILKNYGSLGASADLVLDGVAHTRYDGIRGLSFDGTSSTASNDTLHVQIPQKWSYAYWVKLHEVPIIERSIFTLQGLTGGYLRAWADSQGIWAWQKYSVADAYSILPASDFPTSNMMLVVAVYDDPLLPPVQMRTSQGLAGIPAQPESYAMFNEATGSPLADVTSICIGGSPGGTNIFNGIIGPVYMWSRPISESEIWQLWQDLYAPFRRNSEQVIVPSRMVSSQGSSLQGTGKQSDAKPSFNDIYALFIDIHDDIQYVSNPVDTVISDSQVLDYISIIDGYDYQQLPTDALDSDAPFSLITLDINDAYMYQVLPVDTVVAPESGVIGIDTIVITDGYTYTTEPVESVLSDTQPLQNLNITDTVDYIDTPTDTIVI